MDACIFLTWDGDLRKRFDIAKYAYCFGFIATSVATWVLRDYGQDWFAQHVDTFNFCSDSQYEGLCSGKEIAMRISFGNFVFFAVHFLLLLGLKRNTDWRVGIHASLWLWKVVVWLGTLVGFFFVPTKTLYGYAQVARFGSGLFLILQLILLINFIYEVNEWLVEQEQRWSWALLIIGTIASVLLGLAAIAASIHLYAPDPSCHLNIFFVSWSLVIGIAMVAVLFLPKRAPTAGLLTSGAVFLYASYLLISAFSSQPRDEDESGYSQCVRGSGAGSKWIQVVGFFIAMATVIYSTASAGVASRDMFGQSSKYDEDSQLPYRADFFHFVFAVASMYIAMLFTNWQVSPSTNQFELDQGYISMWVKMGSKWAIELLYIWTVIAPALLRNRDFS